MARFSERIGLKATRSLAQLDSMDGALRNRLWNVVYASYFNSVTTDDYAPRFMHTDEDAWTFVIRLWHDHFKHRTDTIADNWPAVCDRIREHFFDCAWNEVYDFLEFVGQKYPNSYRMTHEKFMRTCNAVLEEEVSAYRFVGGLITQITSQDEIAAVEEAQLATEPLRGVSTHLKTALDLLSNRESPDYRNSIKESISAVEAMCQRLAGQPKATLGQALKRLEATVPLHSALKKAFGNLYGYTNDAEGIRHALLEESDLTQDDAKFMLVTCSAFVSYLLAQAAKAGVDLGMEG